MGRPTKLTAKTQAQICKALEDGNTRKAAANLAGVTYTSFNKWMHRAEGDDAGGIFVTFVDAVEKAEAEAEARHVAGIQTAAQNGTWQADAWWLERRRRADYGKNETVEHTGGINITNIPVEWVEPDRDDGPSGGNGNGNGSESASE